MKKIRVAQIGCGHDHATAMWGSINRLSGGIFDIAGYYLPEEEKKLYPERVKAFDGAKELSLDEILNDPAITAVVVETQEISLTKYSLLCAQHGKHIQMDKPGGLDADLFETLVRTMKEKGLIFHLGYMYRYNEAVMDLMDRIGRGELGEIYCIEAHMDCRHTPEKRQWLSAFPGGMLFFLGCHLIDLIFRIQGMPEKILPLSTCTRFDGVTAEDYGMALFQYKNGHSFAKTCAQEMGGYARRQLVVCGEKETVEIKPLEMYDAQDARLLYSDVTVFTSPVWADQGTTHRTPSRDRYDTMMTAFAQMVNGEKENPYTYEYELALYRVLLAACGVEIDYKRKIDL